MTSPTTTDALAPRHYPQAVLRLTALWAVVESGLGGVLHAFRLPLTGLVVGGTAVLLITLIAHFARRPREILRATLLVLIVKALVSPHSPLGAYVAVGFQGVLGWGLYSLSRPSLVTALPFAVIALLESALQKLLMLVLVFGRPFWAALDGYGAWVVERFFPNQVGADWSLSWTLVGLYVGIYAVGGVAVGGFAARLPRLLERQLRGMAIGELDVSVSTAPPAPAERPRSRWRRLGGWLAVALVLGVAVYLGEQDGRPLASAALYLVRTLAIVVTWYFLVGPWLAGLFRGWLLGQRTRYADDLGAVMDLLPALRGLGLREYRALSVEVGGLRLYSQWLLRLLALTLTVRLSPKLATAQPVHA